MAEIVNLDKQVKNKPKRNEKGQLLPGNTANKDGRPKGKTMKEFARELLMLKTDDAKLNWLKDIPKETLWKMAEGNPSNDVTLDGDLPFQIIVNKIEKKVEDKNKIS